MTVKEIVMLAAENLNRDDLSSALKILEGETEGEIKSLVRCYNLVENEVALDYFPLRKSETFLPENGAVYYTAFTSAPVNILKVTDGAGREIPYTVQIAHLALAEDEDEVTVTYSYAPCKKTLADDSEFAGKISARLLSYGVASEFLLTSARYQEAAVWEQKFHDALRAANLLRRKLCVRSRRWA